MIFYRMKNGTLIPYDSTYIICRFTETIISSKTGTVIFALGDEVEDYIEKHLEFWEDV